MKRGKDDEKMVGPMFPRLHVNDTEKGGPRAPPRNKMALYEQLSIPSQRFNSNLVPDGYSIQGSGLEKKFSFPLHVTPTSSHQAEKLHSRQVGGNLNTSSAQLGQSKKVGNEDDFRVPVFVQSRVGECLRKTENCIDREKPSPLNQNYFIHSTDVQSAGDNDQNNNSCRGPILRQDTGNQNEDNLEVYVSGRDHSVGSSTRLPTREKISRPGDAYPNQQKPDHHVANFSRLCEKDAYSQQESTALLQQNNSGHGEVAEMTRQIEKGNTPPPRSESHSREDLSSPNEPEIDSEFCGNQTCRSLQFANDDKTDDISETSMVDSISVLDISPDDAVGIIGQKHFWKARRAIVNQQRLFARQVFELHRLIKVQQLIAASPHILLEGGTYLGTSPKKVSPAKKLISEYVVSPPVHVGKRKNDSENPNHEMESSAENAVGKASFSSVKNGTQPSNCGPYLGNPPSVPVATDSLMGPWCLHHSVGHQWLVPVMSPSEGLVYKPYTAPGFMGSAFGGCGPFGLSPAAGNFMNPTYGVPVSHHHYQGTGFMAGAPPGVHGYFPPYAAPVMNPALSGSAVEQMNYIPQSGSHGQTDPLSGGANFNMQRQSSGNVPTQKNGSIPQVAKFCTSKDTELQGSTASSPGGKAQGVGNFQANEGRDASPLFTVAPERASQPQETDQPMRVIKVVPHNARTATESAARIFKSIQEERKQHD